MNRITGLARRVGPLLLTSALGGGATVLLVLLIRPELLFGMMTWLWLGLPLLVGAVWFFTLAYLALVTVPTFTVLKHLRRTDRLSLGLVGGLTPSVLMILVTIGLDRPSFSAMFDGPSPYLSGTDLKHLLAMGVLGGGWSMGLLYLYQYLVKRHDWPLPSS